MNEFISYLKKYCSAISPLDFLLTTLFTGLLILINYSLGLEKAIRSIPSLLLGYIVFVLFFLSVYSTAWMLQYRRAAWLPAAGKKQFILLVIAAALLFSGKMMLWPSPAWIHRAFSCPWDQYWARILQAPVKLLGMVFFLWIIWKFLYPGQTFFGCSLTGFKAAPYFKMLLLVIPLILWASGRPDFLHSYPKYQAVAFINGSAHPAWPWRLLYELSYGMDFISIELFFRGFLVLGFIRFAGMKAILPMAAFYCTIHFGKPLAECISSYFGGLILGVIVYHTRSIYGGLIVHLGLAWMMEVGGYAGHLLCN